ncbi:MAG: prepilin-type N-terminal cleavage/methylation domain-containing protein [Gammaproteobacteria bacterium]|nr:prepilin-type N-terminal cleavage/methylation domain-containing protein [Gammaproteobacteria bacterium]
MPRQRGFSLVELMIAVAILAVIAAIAIPLYQGYINEARIGTAIKDIRQAELILDDLALDNGLAGLDGNTGTVRGMYLQSGTLVLGAVGTAPSGTKAWLDPWDRIYRYQRNTADNSGVRTDASGAISNSAAASPAPQAYDVFSLGPDGVQNSDDIVRGCNGAFVGVDADHPSC